MPEWVDQQPVPVTPEHLAQRLHDLRTRRDGPLPDSQAFKWTIIKASSKAHGKPGSWIWTWRAVSDPFPHPNVQPPGGCEILALAADYIAFPGWESA